MHMVSEGTPGFREYDGFERGWASQGTRNTNGRAEFSIRVRNTPWRGHFQAMHGDALRPLLFFSICLCAGETVRMVVNYNL
jgi:hypothetical protein